MFRKDAGTNSPLAGKYILIEKETFKCFRCRLNNQQISEIVDLLKRDIEIAPETIARFNRRKL